MIYYKRQWFVTSLAYVSLCKMRCAEALSAGVVPIVFQFLPKILPFSAFPAYLLFHMLC